MARSKPIPFFLNITLYSLMVIQIIFLFVYVLVVSRLDEMLQLQSYFQGEKSGLIWGPGIYVSIIYILGTIFSLIQMLRQKLYAAYIFHALSLFLMSFFVFNSPIEWLSIATIIVVNMVISLHYSWFKAKTVIQEDEMITEIAESE